LYSGGSRKGAMRVSSVLIVSSKLIVMKMILEVKLFVSAESEEIVAGDLKKFLANRATQVLKDKNVGNHILSWNNDALTYRTLDGRKLEATVKWLTENEAYDSLK
jgi:hypothetical protein